MTAGAILLALALASAQPATTNNNAACDIVVAPAATLLLPYFEVDTTAAIGAGSNTLFTVTNTSRYPQIAHVTVWTDWAFPVLNFNLFLTGYDVQSVSLYDVIVRGLIPGTSITTPPGTAFDASGSIPSDNTSNPNFFIPGRFDVRTGCADLPHQLPEALVNAVRNALTTGAGYVTNDFICNKGPNGGNHGTRAIGYITIDVVSRCSTQFPTEPNGSYFLGPNASILFDNVLIGDYQQLGPLPDGFGGYFQLVSDAQGSPMVHIRAVPEGGLSWANDPLPPVSLPYTFYDRYTPAAARTVDRRQPLPSTFGVHYIQGGIGEFATDFKIWREGVTAGLPTCTSAGTVQNNSVIMLTSIVRFDEHDNSWDLFVPCYVLCAPILPNLPATSRRSSNYGFFPLFGSSDLAGWMYFNLSNGSSYASYSQTCTRGLSAQRAGFGDPYCATEAPGKSGSRSTSQNWVTASLYGRIGNARLSVEYDAAWLGNGCTPAESWQAKVAPATQRGGPLVCPAGAKCASATQPPVTNP